MTRETPAKSTAIGSPVRAVPDFVEPDESALDASCVDSSTFIVNTKADPEACSTILEKSAAMDETAGVGIGGDIGQDSTLAGSTLDESDMTDKSGMDRTTGQGTSCAELTQDDSLECDETAAANQTTGVSCQAETGEKETDSQNDSTMDETKFESAIGMLINLLFINY